MGVSHTGGEITPENKKLRDAIDSNFNTLVTELTARVNLDLEYPHTYTESEVLRALKEYLS